MSSYCTNATNYYITSAPASYVSFNTSSSVATITYAATTNIYSTLNKPGVVSSITVAASNILTYDTTTTCLLSDLRDKENIRHNDIHGLKEIMAFKPISYDVKASANPVLHALGRQVGLGAQDVVKVDPRLVGIYQNGPRKGTPSSVRYEQMVAVLIKAIQEQQAEIDTLKARLKP